MPSPSNQNPSLGQPLQHLHRDVDEHRLAQLMTDRLRGRISESGGWLRFDDFMRVALYEPGLGYYSGGSRKFGRLAGDGSDFVTAPEASPLFARALARQVAQVLSFSAPAVLEFGAGSGALAAGLLEALGNACERYEIIELSASLREVQHSTVQRLAPDHLHKVKWLGKLPASFAGCMIANEVLDAMPVRLVQRADKSWLERGVVWHGDEFAFATVDADADLSATIAARIDAGNPLPPGYQTEIAEEAPAMVATVADVLTKGAAIFIDYGFPQAEYFHPQRAGGTLMCHEGHLSDTNPLVHVGRKDITAHVDFTAVALAGQDAGLDVAGYTSQARFLINCGIASLMEAADRKGRTAAQLLVAEHEMGELFKVIAFTKGFDAAHATLAGFSAGDRTHTL